MTAAGTGKSISDMVFNKYKTPLRNRFISFSQLELLRQAKWLQRTQVYRNIINNVYISTALKIAPITILSADKYYKSVIYQGMQQFYTVDKKNSSFNKNFLFNTDSLGPARQIDSLLFKTASLKPAGRFENLKTEKADLFRHIEERVRDRGFEGFYDANKGLNTGYPKLLKNVLSGNGRSNINEADIQSRVQDNVDLKLDAALKTFLVNSDFILKNEILKSYEFITKKFNTRANLTYINPAPTLEIYKKNGLLHAVQDIMQNTSVKRSFRKINRFIETDEHNNYIRKTEYNNSVYDNLTYKEVKINHARQSREDREFRDNQEYSTRTVQLSNKIPDNTSIPPVIDIGKLVDRVYSELERKIRSEKERIGL
ncbi:MAG TPA: hypothetical protein VHT34_04055 [Clostridia bacterium]|nr:hypothetical protein [Clostridia bacterium]